MRIFSNFNKDSICPICGKSDDGEAVLIPDYKTIKGNICTAKQVHLRCLELQWKEDDLDKGIVYIAQRIEVKA